MSPKTKTKTPDRTKPITRDDIQAKFGELRGEVDDRTQVAKAPAMAIAVGAVVLTVVAAYWFGKRKGKKRQMVLEIRRI